MEHEQTLQVRPSTRGDGWGCATPSCYFEAVVVLTDRDGVQTGLCGLHIPDPTGCYCITDECDGACVAEIERFIDV